MPLFDTMKVQNTVGASTFRYYFRGQASTYAEIAAETGITRAPAEERNYPLTPVEELVAKGVLIRLAVSTGTGPQRKEVKLVCNRNNLGPAMEGLIGKTIRNSLILTARIPQKAIFY